jgi:predicted ATPase/signal transduction histidine kinase
VYTVREVLHTSSRAVLYRGSRDGDGAAVVIKALGPQHRPQHLERLRHEYSILKTLDVVGVVRPIALESYQGMPALVLEDFGGVSLDQRDDVPMDVGPFLALALKIAAATVDIHGKNVVHKDLKPENILVHPGTGEVKISDFGIAAPLPCQQPALDSARLIEGSLPYMSPEQSGRMNRALDQRSDLYSLGVTFYQLLTGRLPFQATDPLEWVHCHVARSPTPPAEILPTIPLVISAIIMKLLAKEPEERYQSARGLVRDLERCLAQWSSRRTVDGFVLGEWDEWDRLLIPQKLYGRNQELAALLGAFHRVVDSGTPELVLVSGYSGIGKSALVHELQKPIVRARGVFASGKFDQYKRDVPYSTIVAALTEQVLEILAGSEDSIARWRERVRAALGRSGQLVVDVIPPLELAIGPQPPVPALPPTEAQNRFRIVFRHFIGVFSAPEHPLALFLDDLQWADPASLALVQELITHPETRQLFLVGAYRDNEVSASHPLMSTIREVQKSGAQVSKLVLGPLPHQQLGAFLGDALHQSGEPVEALADLVQEKTAGNPFFAIQFLGTLQDEGLIELDADAGGFRWDMARIRAMGFTENVVDLMVDKLRRLPVATQAALEQLACLGNSASVESLALTLGRSEEEVHADLSEAGRAGLILRLGDAYRFLHDRVQEAAYSLVPAGHRAEAHLRIGRLLLAHLSPQAIEQRIFEVVNQLNRGVALIAEARERESLCRLNVLAAKKARSSIAYGAACSHLAQAMALLPADAWSTDYEETFTLHLTRAESEYLVGQFRTADELFNLLLEKAGSNLDRARVYGLRTRLYQISGRYSDSLTVALEALQLFDVRCPDSDEALQAAFLAENQEVNVNLRGRRIAELVDAPLVSDPVVKAVIGLLVDAMPCAYVARSQVFPLLVVKALNFSLRYGNAAESCFVYSCYSIMLVAAFGDIPAAFEFSQMSLRLNQKLGDAKLGGTLLFMHGAFVNYWRRHLSTTRAIMADAMAASLEVGDLVYASYNCCQSVWHAVEAGDPLDEVLRVSEKYAAFARQIHSDTVLRVVQQYQQYVAALKGRTRKPTSLEDDHFDEAAVLAVFTQSGFHTGIFFHHMLKQIAAFTFGHHGQALAEAERARPVLGAVMGTVFEASHLFYEALTLAALHPTAGADRQQEITALLSRQLEKLKLWADNCPDTHGCHHLLVSAELARLEGRDLESTLRLYDQAIRSAAESGFVHKEALGNELAAGFFAARGLERIADTYLREARACYVRWGADAKVKQLDALHPRLRERRSLLPTVTLAVDATQIDVLSVVKASQAISGEIVLDALLGKLVRVVIEQAGAQKGYVILPREGGLFIEAEALVDDGGEVTVGLLRSLPVSASPLVPASIVNYVWRTKQKVLLDNAAAASSKFAGDDYLARTQAKSVLCLPIARQAEVAGLLYLENNLVAGAFTVAHLEVLELVAVQAAISLENALLLAKEKAGRAAAEASEHRKAFLAEAGVLFSGSLDYGWILRQVGELCVRDFADWCVIDRVVDGQMKRLVGVHRDPTKQALLEELQQRYPPRPGSPHPASRVMTSGQPTLLPDATEAELRARCEDEHHFRLISALGTLTALCVPLIARGQTIGALTLGCAQPGRHYDNADLALAQELAGRAALAMDNARLHQEAVEALNLRNEFLSVASHELYTPLASLILVLETMAPTVTEPGSLTAEALSRSATLAKRQGERLARLIGELLDVTRSSSGPLPLQLGEVDLTVLTRDVLDRFAPDLTRARCAASFESTGPIVGRWDRSRLDQVIANLLSNAIKFGQGRPLEVSLAREDGMARLRVRDHGIGIAASEQGKIFERFRRGVSPAHYGGLGLGLYICRGLVEAHGGKISVESAPGAGAAFTVELPCIPERSA